MTTPLAQALFADVFDNAAMYPPAKAPMEAALALHAITANASWGFARGRLLCPASRLRDLPAEMEALGLAEMPLRIGAVVGSPADPNARTPLKQVVGAIGGLSYRHPSLMVEIIEVRPVAQSLKAWARDVVEIASAADAAAVGTAYVEVPVAGQPVDAIFERLAAIAETNADVPVSLGAKVRCGGLEPGMVPTREQLATFIVAARQVGLPFKATAGLHQAFSAADGSRHGFVSLMLAATAGHALDLDVAETAKLLRQSSAQGLRAEDDRLTIGDAKLYSGQITAARAETMTAFGTCSFTEPAADAARLMTKISA